MIRFAHIKQQEKKVFYIKQMWRLLSCLLCSALIILIWPSTITFLYACDPGGKCFGLKYKMKLKFSIMI